MKDVSEMTREELEEECAYYRSEISIVKEDALIAKLKDAGIKGNHPARLALVLYRAAPRKLSKRYLLAYLQECGSQAEGRKIIDVYLSNLRRVLGPDAFETSWALGVSLTPAGKAAIAAFGVSHPLPQLAA